MSGNEINKVEPDAKSWTDMPPPALDSSAFKHWACVYLLTSIFGFKCSKKCVTLSTMIKHDFLLDI